MSPGKRRLAAIMFTDLVGYSALAQRDESLSLELLEAHRRLLRPLIARHHGDEVKSMGDGLMVEFPSALEAVQCAVAMQEALQRHNADAPVERRLQVRIGVHLGDVVHRDGDVFGDGVNIASRIEPLAQPGGICISEYVHDQVRRKLKVPVVSLGKPALKHIDDPIEVFRLVLPWEERSAKARAADKPWFLRPRPYLIGLFVVFFLAAAGWGVFNALTSKTLPEILSDASETDAAVAPGPIESIAVLPFLNLSSDAEHEYFSDGLTEELINAIAQVEGLRVISRTSAFAFKGRELDVRTIGGELGVDAILEGSVRRSGSRVRISTQLVSVADGTTLWSRTFDQQLEDVFAIQESIARATVDTLKLELLADGSQDLVQPTTESLTAYEEYLQGRFYWNKRTGDGFEQALAHFNAALEADPDYAKAHAGLADTYSLMVSYDVLLPDEGYPQAREAANRALALDPTLAEAHTSLAFIEENESGNLEAAEALYREAIAINPNYATAHHWYSILLEEQGRLDEALAEAERALALDPLSPIINVNLASKYQSKGELDRAIERLEKAVELAPDFRNARQSLANVQMLEGGWASAREQYEALLQDAPEAAGVRLGYASLLQYQGHLEEALTHIEHVLARNPEHATAHQLLGVHHYWTRQFDAAREAFTRAQELNPQLQFSGNLGLIDLWQGRYDDALERLEHALEAASDNPMLVRTLRAMEAIGLAMRGDEEAAREALTALAEEKLERNQQFPSLVSIAYFQLGELDRGFAWLEKAFALKDPTIASLKVEPLFDPARADPRFEQYLERIGLTP